MGYPGQYRSLPRPEATFQEARSRSGHPMLVCSACGHGNIPGIANISGHCYHYQRLGDEYKGYEDGKLPPKPHVFAYEPVRRIG